MSEHELPVSSSNSFERADDMPVVQADNQTSSSKSLHIVAPSPEVPVSGDEITSYGYGSIPRSIGDVENGLNPPYVENTSSDELVHDLTRRRIFSSCMCTYLFFIAMDSSIILVIASKIASEFHELWRLSLVISAYLLSNAIGQLVFLKLSLISSVKLLLCIAQFSFVLGGYLSWSSAHFGRLSLPVVSQDLGRFLNSAQKYYYESVFSKERQSVLIECLYDNICYGCGNWALYDELV